MPCHYEECVTLYVKVVDISREAKDLIKDPDFKPQPGDDEQYGAKSRDAIRQAEGTKYPVPGAKINKACPQGCECAEQRADETEAVPLGTPLKITFKVSGRATWIKCKKGKVIYVIKRGVCYEPQGPTIEVPVQPR